MAQNDIQVWIERAALQPGVLACGVKASQSTTVKSVYPTFPERRVKELMQALSEVGLTLRQDHVAGGRWRWVFENGQIHSVRRQDGAFAVVILATDAPPTTLVDSVLAEFISSAAPPEPPAATATSLALETAGEIAAP